MSAGQYARSGGSYDYLLYFAITIVLCAGAFGMYDEATVAAAPRSAGPASGSSGGASSWGQPFPGVTRMRLALMGADERPGDVGRSDTLMVLWLNPEQKRAAIMSLPRDLKVSIPGHGVTKINAAYAYGGPELSMRTASELLQVPLDGYLKVNFEGFVKAVDVLGGVDILVDDVEGKGRGMNYDDSWGNLHIHLTPGWHHLNGYEAMGFCRYRKSMYKGLGDGDFKRAERQQQFLRAMVEQKLKLQNLPSLLKAAKEIMGCLDTNLSWRQCIDLARLLKEMGSGAIKTMTIPARDAMSGGVYFCETNSSDLERLLTEIDQHLDGVAEAAFKVTVLNGCGEAGAADKAADVLRTAGFQVLTTGNAGTYSYDATRILYRGENRDAALAAATALGTGLVEASEQEQFAADEKEGAEAPTVTIIVGRDFTRQPRDNKGTTKEG